MGNYGYISSIEELQEFADRLIEENKILAIDIEQGYPGSEEVKKGSVRSETALLVGISFANSIDWARYVPLAHDLADNMDNYQVAEVFWNLFNNLKVIAHNLKYELRNLSRWFVRWLSDHPIFGEQVRATRGYFKKFSCTMIESYILAETSSHGLKSLIEKHFGHKMIQIMSLFPNLPKNREASIRFNTLELSPLVVDYACEDALWCWALHDRNYEAIQNDPKKKFIYNLEMGILDIICEMEDFGLCIDWEMLRQATADAEEFITAVNTEIQTEFSEAVGEKVIVNLSSPKQLREMLYDRMGLATSVLTDTGELSTGRMALEGLQKTAPIVGKILMWKDMKKLLTSYLNKYERDYRYAPDDKVHPQYNQALLPAGRFSVNDPNTQQLPKKYDLKLNSGVEFHLNFRDAIVAPSEYYILGFDYSQQEVRAMAGEAKEPFLLNAFKTGLSVHALTAGLCMDIPEHVYSAPEFKETKEYKKGKTLNLALLYLMSHFSLAKRLDISVEEAEELYIKYYQYYSAITPWQDKIQKFGKEHHYIETVFGRKVPIFEYESPNFRIRNKAPRIAVNARIQGSATGDYPKIAMVRARRVISEKGWNDLVRLAMNIHDQLEFYVHRSLDPKTIIDALEPAVVFPVKGWPEIVADWHVGFRLGSMKDIHKGNNGNLYVKDPTPDEEDIFSDAELESGYLYESD